MNVKPHSSSGKGGSGLKRMSSVMGETLEVCIHQILYILHVYPRDLFAPTRYLDIRVHGCRHVSKYISMVVALFSFVNLYKIALVFKSLKSYHTSEIFSL